MADIKYTVTLTESEDKAMQYIAYSVQDWIDNAVINRARKAIEQIYSNEVARMTDDPDINTIPADKNQVILDADLETAKTRQDKLQASE